MDIFTRNKFLLRIIFVLIFLNLFMTAYLWLRKQEGPGDHQPRNRDNPMQVQRERDNSIRILRDKMHLSKEQEAGIIKLREEYSMKEEGLTEMIKLQRDSMNVIMFHSDTDTNKLKDIAWRVAQNEYQMELLRINQAKQLKTICTEEQLKDFQRFLSEIRDFFQPKKKKE